MRESQPYIDTARPIPWRHSLYSRALAVMGVGSLLLLAGVVFQSTIVVEEFVDQLLQDRFDLAEATGSHLEEEIELDLNRIAAGLVPAFGQVPDGDMSKVTEALERSAMATFFERRAFVSDPDGTVLAAAQSVDVRAVERIIRRQDVIKKAQSGRGVAVSRIIQDDEHASTRLVFVMPLLDGRAPHLYVGGVAEPDRVNLLRLLGIEKSAGVYQVIDAGGTVVATTDSADLFAVADHDAVLTQAIRDRREVRGRCHSCHVHEGEEEARVVDVLAFAPLPRLGLGVALRQAEEKALAPAFAMRRRLVWSAVAYVLAFLVFAGLAVRSVVQPLSSLIRSVRRVRTANPAAALPPFGNNEVGELGRAIDQWRSRVADAMSETEEHQHALRAEVESSNRLLAALQQITEFSMRAEDVATIVQHGLEKLMAMQGFPAGTLCLRYRKQSFCTQVGLGVETAESARKVARNLLDEAAVPIASGLRNRCRTRLIDARDYPAIDVGGTARTVLAADLVVPWGLSLVCALVSPYREDQIEDERLHSLLHHILVGAANRLLQDEQQRRHQMRQELLGRVLEAQEEERRRLARELHDTVSQDLAAIRLQIERLGNLPEADGGGARARQLEEQVQGLLSTVRRITLDLRPLVLDRLGFIPALQWHLERLEREYDIRGQLVVDGVDSELERNVSVSLFRIFQESLNNVVQHAEAPHVFVTLTYAADSITMTVEDDGKGFNRAQVAGPLTGVGERGLGLLGMEERARLLGGELTIESAPEDGTIVRVTLPLQPAAQAAEGRFA